MDEVVSQRLPSLVTDVLPATFVFEGSDSPGASRSALDQELMVFSRMLHGF